MDEPTLLSDAEAREIKSRTVRNYAASSVFVSAALLLFTIMVQLLSGNYGNKTSYTVDNTVGASRTYYLYVTPPGSKALSDTPFYDENADPYGNQPWSSNYAGQQVVVTVTNGCDTKYGAYQLLISGLTPYGYYRVQTDKEDFSFGYGYGGYANGYGQATYDWDCFRSDGSRIPDGTYDVLVTDKTGFAKVIALPVGFASSGK